jgi:hypothetical protein
VRCAANATTLIELIALQTKQGEWWRVFMWHVRLLVVRSFPACKSKHLNFAISQPTRSDLSQTRDSKTYLSTQPNHLTTFDHPQHPSIIIAFATISPSQSNNIININMRSSAVLFGVAAFVAAVSGQTGMFAHSLIKSSPCEHALTPLLVTVTVTETETNCGAGKCQHLAGRQASSDGSTSINALSVLSSAYYSAISAYASAQATDSSLPSFSFVPDLFSSYGLTEAASTNDPSSPTAAPSSSPDASPNPTDTENSQTSIATSVVPVGPGASSVSPPSYSEGPATTPSVTPSPASGRGLAGESTANPAESSATVALPVPSSITESSAVSSYLSSVAASLSSAATDATANPTGTDSVTEGETASPTDSASYTASPTDAESSTASITESPTESSTDEPSASSTEADAGSATTTEAPPAEQTDNAAGTNQLPMALGGLAAAAAGLLFI